MYATPHAWTPFGRESENREVVQLDQEKWDYRHQVLAQKDLMGHRRARPAGAGPGWLDS